jgi:dipeptidase D
MGCQSAPPVILQGHMDMVCEKTPASDHDFTKDPIKSKMDGQWLTAEGTTLGADNGIAIAYALALADDPQVRHPALELLFTVDEESGLKGVKNLQADMLKGRTFINLDSEDEGVFTVGCAGGQETELTLDLQAEPLAGGHAALEIVVSGLSGGHSGIDIDKNRANANKIVARTLEALRRVSTSRLVYLKGGSRHNAIPRDAQAVIACPAAETSAVEKAVSEILRTFQQECGQTEKQLCVSVAPAEAPAGHALSLADTDRCIWMLLSLPNGVATVSATVPGAVETSCNLAMAEFSRGRLRVLSSQRSSVGSRLAEITSRVTAVAHLAGARSIGLNTYPAWPANVDSDLLRRARAVYKQQFGKEPVVQVIHAGLECAIIGELVQDMDMISFGPTICNPHSPDERIHVPSVEKVWTFLKALLADLADHA